MSRQCFFLFEQNPVMWEVIMSCLPNLLRSRMVVQPRGGGRRERGVFRFISVEEMRKPFLGLKLGILDFLWVRNLLVKIFGDSDFGGIF